MSASQAIFRTVEAVTGPVKSIFPVCSVAAPGWKGCRWCRPGWCLQVAVAGDVSEPGEQVAVVDGDHDLGSEPSGGGKGAGGEDDFGGADEAVEAFLRLCAKVQGRGTGVIFRRPAAREEPCRLPAPPRLQGRSCPGAVVRGLVAVFMTVRRCPHCSAVAKISRCWSPWRGLRMKAPWSWRRSSRRVRRRPGPRRRSSSGPRGPGSRDRSRPRSGSGRVPSRRRLRGRRRAGHGPGPG